MLSLVPLNADPSFSFPQGSGIRKPTELLFLEEKNKFSASRKADLRFYSDQIRQRVGVDPKKLEGEASQLASELNGLHKEMNDLLEGHRNNRHLDYWVSLGEKFNKVTLPQVEALRKSLEILPDSEELDAAMTAFKSADVLMKEIAIFLRVHLIKEMESGIEVYGQILEQLEAEQKKDPENPLIREQIEEVKKARKELQAMVDSLYFDVGKESAKVSVKIVSRIFKAAKDLAESGAASILSKVATGVGIFSCGLGMAFDTYSTYKGVNKIIAIDKEADQLSQQLEARRELVTKLEEEAKELGSSPEAELKIQDAQAQKMLITVLENKHEYVTHDKKHSAIRKLTTSVLGLCTSILGTIEGVLVLAGVALAATTIVGQVIIGMLTVLALTALAVTLYINRALVEGWFKKLPHRLEKLSLKVQAWFVQKQVEVIDSHVGSARKPHKVATERLEKLEKDLANLREKSLQSSASMTQQEAEEGRLLERSLQQEIEAARLSVETAEREQDKEAIAGLLEEQRPLQQRHAQLEQELKVVNDEIDRIGKQAERLFEAHRAGLNSIEELDTNVARVHEMLNDRETWHLIGSHIRSEGELVSLFDQEKAAEQVHHWMTS